ncbi:6-phosphogluconolactonase [Atractiella rhizophila]|nr:6-phosphogluconolactonase [Atractiella rhizophila]
MAAPGIAPPATSPNKPILFTFPSTSAVSSALADFVIRHQNEALEKRDKFKIALSGGSLPKILGAELGRREGVRWGDWEIFFADERIVPLDSEDSNYRACKEELFSKVPIPEANIHPLNVDLLDKPEECAEEYEQQLITSFAGKNAVAFPRFDLILLGMGPDGHTCSLFPGHPLLSEELRWVAALDDSPKPPPKRITLTFPVLNHAYNCAFVATGEGKKETLRTILDKPEEGLPCSRIVPSQPGKVYWFVDEPAASLVKYGKQEFKL